MGRSGVENVVLDRHVLIIKLIDEAERCNGLSIGAEALLTEFLRNNL
jgi:hypothetical protein